VKAKKATVMIPLTTRAATIMHAAADATRTAPYVFTQSDGRAYSLEQVGMAVIRTAKQAQLPGVSLHTLRHTFISRLVQAGRPLAEVAALAGHRDITMTLALRIWRPVIYELGSRRWSNGVPVTRQDPRYPQNGVSRWCHGNFLTPRKWWCPQQTTIAAGVWLWQSAGQ
jgi:integrase